MGEGAEETSSNSGSQESRNYFYNSVLAMKFVVLRMFLAAALVALHAIVDSLLTPRLRFSLAGSADIGCEPDA